MKKYISNPRYKITYSPNRCFPYKVYRRSSIFGIPFWHKLNEHISNYCEEDIKKDAFPPPKHKYNWIKYYNSIGQEI